MARRRFRRARASSRRASPFRRVSRRRSKSGSRGLMKTAVGAMAYGAVREKVSNALIPITGRFGGFLGTLADEAGMALLTGVVMKKFPSGMLHDIARAGFTIEMARVGEAVVSGGLLGGATAPQVNLLASFR